MVTPFQVIRAFGVTFRLSRLRAGEIGLDTPVWGTGPQGNTACLARFELFGEVYFAGLCVGHR